MTNFYLNKTVEYETSLSFIVFSGCILQSLECEIVYTKASADINNYLILIAPKAWLIAWFWDLLGVIILIQLIPLIPLSMVFDVDP